MGGLSHAPGDRHGLQAEAQALQAEEVGPAMSMPMPDQAAPQAPAPMRMDVGVRCCGETASTPGMSEAADQADAMGC